MTQILMVAAENGTIPGAKVGGIGDVVRDIPPVLSQRDCAVSVVIPSYGRFHKLENAKVRAELSIEFRGKPQIVVLYELCDLVDDNNVKHYVIDAKSFCDCGEGVIYCNDSDDRPFATDASKFALFCMAVAEGIKQNAFGQLNVLHLHDWHAAFLLILRKYMPRYQAIQNLLSTYTIHNLALQGIRPFRGDDESALENWFPKLSYQPSLLSDPRWSDCFNPMACGIRMSDTVHAVSPSYAEEIISPSQSDIGHFGGEGLEQDLQNAKNENRLFGILNGCDYPSIASKNSPKTSKKQNWIKLLDQMQSLVMVWASKTQQLESAHFIAHNKLKQLSEDRPKMILTSVGRITNQKIDLMRQVTSNGKPALHEILEKIKGYGLILILGSGDDQYEQFLVESSAQYDNLIFLRGYSDQLANEFYSLGDLFFMPSLFEPCGISQMLALRSGQPCLVHKVGGLGDTIIDGKTGFVFSSHDLISKADAMVESAEKAIALHKKPAKWKVMSKASAAARFPWSDSIDCYLQQLYKVS